MFAHVNSVISRTSWLGLVAVAALAPVINANASGTAPTIGGVPPQRVIAGSQWYFEPIADDAESDTLTYTIRNKPSWATFWSGTGRLFGTPTGVDVGWHGNIVIEVDDGTSTAALEPFPITVHPWDITYNVAPTISGTPATSVDVGKWYAFQVTATDGNDHSLTYSINNKPPWASFSTNNGALYGRPTAADAGSYGNIVITASDGKASAATAPFSIVVGTTGNNNAPPTITAVPPSRAVVGSQYWTEIRASDADGDPLRFSITNKPPWLTFWAGSGRLFGTPSATDVGVHGQIVVDVTDGNYTVPLPAFSIHVDPTSAINSAPVISGTPKTIIAPDKWYNFLPAASDPDGHALSYGIENKPSWASFNNNTGQLNGRPASSDVGVYANIRIRVTDGIATRSLAAFSINVGITGAGSAILSWTPPTRNTDGSLLTNLAGYRIYYGTSPGSYPNTITLENPGLASYVVENLQNGTYYFVMTSVNTQGIESDYSGEATKVLN